MPTCPLAAGSPLRTVRPIDGPVRVASRRRRDLRLALCAAAAGLVLLMGGGVSADEDALATPPPSPGEIAPDPTSSDPIGDGLATIFAGLDRGIRSLTTGTDRAASRALQIGLGVLADGHDRTMRDRTRTALAGSRAAAQRHFELASVDAPPPSRDRAGPRSDAEIPGPIDDRDTPAAPPAARSLR